MDVERALRESLATNDLTLWSASGACVVDVDEATRNLAASLAARGVAPSPDAPGHDSGYVEGWDAAVGVAALGGGGLCAAAGHADHNPGDCVFAPSPDAPRLPSMDYALRDRMLGVAFGVAPSPKVRHPLSGTVVTDVTGAFLHPETFDGAALSSSTSDRAGLREAAQTVVDAFTSPIDHGIVMAPVAEPKQRAAIAALRAALAAQSKEPTE